jgi:excisionase family DNA binding protein
MLTSEAVASLLAVSVPTLRRWVKAGTWPKPVRFGRRLLWPRDVVERRIARAQRT